MYAMNTHELDQRVIMAHLLSLSQRLQRTIRHWRNYDQLYLMQDFLQI